MRVATDKHERANHRRDPGRANDLVLLAASEGDFAVGEAQPAHLISAEVVLAVLVPLVRSIMLLLVVA